MIVLIPVALAFAVLVLIIHAIAPVRRTSLVGLHSRARSTPPKVRCGDVDLGPVVDRLFQACGEDCRLMTTGSPAERARLRDLVLSAKLELPRTDDGRCSAPAGDLDLPRWAIETAEVSLARRVAAELHILDFNVFAGAVGDDVPAWETAATAFRSSGMRIHLLEPLRAAGSGLHVRRLAGAVRKASEIEFWAVIDGRFTNAMVSSAALTFYVTNGKAVSPCAVRIPADTGSSRIIRGRCTPSPQIAGDLALNDPTMSLLVPIQTEADRPPLIRLRGWMPSPEEWDAVMQIAAGTAEASRRSTSRLATDLAASGARLPMVGPGAVNVHVGNNFVAVYRSDELQSRDVMLLERRLEVWDREPLDSKDVMRFVRFDHGATTAFSLLNQTVPRFTRLKTPAGAKEFAFVDHANATIRDQYQPSGAAVAAGFESTPEMKTSYRVLLLPGARAILTAAPKSEMENPMKIGALVKFIALAAADVNRGMHATAEIAVADATDDTGSTILAGPVVSSAELKRTAAAEAYPVDVLTIALLGLYFAAAFGGVRRSRRDVEKR